MWDACFGNRVAAFRLCVTSGRRRKRIHTNRTTNDKYRSSLPTSVIRSRRPGNELWPLGILNSYFGALKGHSNWASRTKLTYKRRRNVLFVGYSSEHGWLHRRRLQVRSASVIKQAALTGVVVVLVGFWLSACTSPTEDTVASPSASQSTAVVPGEKMPDDDRYAPGPMGSSSVRW